MPDAPTPHVQPLSQRMLRFAIVGATGFAVDAALLAALIAWFGLDPFTARLIAITAAAITTWQLNRRITWTKSADGAVREGGRYFTVVITAAVFNYVVYSAVLLVVPETPPLVALVIGTGSAMVLSFLGFDRFAFRR